jgi:hypothetical protein
MNKSITKLAKANNGKVTNSRDEQTRTIMKVNNSLKIEVIKGNQNG